MILLGPIGWFLALGYRRLVAEKVFIEGLGLPVFTSRLKYCALFGLKSGALIWVHFFPLAILYWLLMCYGGMPVAELVSPLVTTLSILLIIPPLFPALLLYYWETLPYIGIFSGIGFLLIFFASTFIMPAVFLQVLVFKSYVRAANPISAWILIMRAPLLYLEAWLLSVCATAVAFIIFPLFPWMIVYSYIVILHAFNQVLWLSDHPWAIKHLNGFKYPMKRKL